MEMEIEIYADNEKQLLQIKRISGEVETITYQQFLNTFYNVSEHGIKEDDEYDEATEEDVDSYLKGLRKNEYGFYILEGEEEAINSLYDDEMPPIINAEDFNHNKISQEYLDKCKNTGKLFKKEDDELLEVAEDRMQNFDADNTLTHEEVIEILGISQEEIDNAGDLEIDDEE